MQRRADTTVDVDIKLATQAPIAGDAITLDRSVAEVTGTIQTCLAPHLDCAPWCVKDCIAGRGSPLVMMEERSTCNALN